MLEYFVFNQIDVDIVENKSVSFQCLLFDVYKHVQYHKTWYSNTYPDHNYVEFAKYNLTLAQEAISYWFQINTIHPCPLDTVIAILQIMTNMQRTSKPYNPCTSAWHMLLFIDQVVEFGGFHPVHQLYCVDTLQSWIHLKFCDIGIVIFDKNATILKYLLQTECYDWKKEYLHLWVSNVQQINKLPVLMDHILLDASWSIADQIIALSVCNTVKQSQVMPILKNLIDILDNERLLNLLINLLNNAVPCSFFNSLELIGLYASLLHPALDLMRDINDGHTILNWISILVYCGDKWNVLTLEHLDMLHQFIVLAIHNTTDLLLRIRLIAFPLNKLTHPFIEELHMFYLAYSDNDGKQLLLSCLLQHEELHSTLDKEQQIYIHDQLLDLQLRPCEEDYDEILAQIDKNMPLVKVTRETTLWICTMESTVVAQWILH